MSRTLFVKVALGGKTAQFALYAGMPVAELGDILEAVLPVGDGRPVGLEAGDGTVYGLSTVCGYPDMLREDSYQLVVRKATSRDNTASLPASAAAYASASLDEAVPQRSAPRGSGSGSGAAAGGGTVPPASLRMWPQLYKRLCVSRNPRVQKLVRALSVLEARGVSLSPKALCEKGTLTGAEATALQRAMSSGDAQLVDVVERTMHDHQRTQRDLIRDVLSIVSTGTARPDSAGAPAGAGRFGDLESDDSSDSDYEAPSGPSDDDDAAYDSAVGGSSGSDGVRSEGSSDSDSDRDPRAHGRPDAPTPAAGELKRIVDDMVDDGDLSSDQGRMLKDLIAQEDEYVFAAYEVYESDEQHDIDELRDTLQRIVRLAPLRSRAAAVGGGTVGAAAATLETYPTEQLEQLVDFLQQRGQVHSSEASALRSFIALEDESLASFYKAYRADSDVRKLADHVIGMVRRKSRAAQAPAEAQPQAAAVKQAAAAAPSSAPASDGQGVPPTSDAAHAAYAQLVDEMRRDAVITGAEATLLRRLFAANDPTCHAAWGVFVADKDRDELKDTLARIVSREKERATQSRQSLVDIVTRLGDAGKLPQHHADVLVDIVNTGHQFTELVAAAVEVYMSSHDTDEFIDTLKLTAKYAFNILGNDSSSDGDAEQAPKDVDNEQAVVNALQQEIGRLINEQQLDAAEGSALLGLADQRDAQTLAAFEVYLTNNDEEDFLDTLQRIARRALNAAASPSAQARASAAAEKEELEAAAALCEKAFTDSDGDVDATGVQAAQMARDGHAIVLGACDVFLVDGDAEDFRDTLTRCVSAFNKEGSDDEGEEDGSDSDEDDDAADGPKFTDEERELIKEHIPFLELSEEGEAALVHCIDSGDRLVHAALEVYHAEADDHDFQDTLRRVAQRAVSVGPILEPLSSPRRGGNAGEDLPAGLEATGEGDADHAAWEGRDGIAKLLDTLVTEGDITRDQRNTLLMKCDNPHRRVFVEGAAEVYWVDGNKAELLDTLNLLL